MNEIPALLLQGFALGLLTIVQPCPITTNVAALTWLGSSSRTTREALGLGLCYTGGLALTYTVLGLALSIGLLSIPGISANLQLYGQRLLGPFFILAGLLVLGWLPLVRKPRLRAPEDLAGESLKRRAGASLLIGATVALAFCPTTAGIFLATLIPLAISQNQPVLLPIFYGLGCGLPMLALAVLFALAREWVMAKVSALTRHRRAAGGLAGGVLIVIGVYFTLTRVYGVL
jgi:cytochrome c biogenesis protein CcdA